MLRAVDPDRLRDHEFDPDAFEPGAPAEARTAIDRFVLDSLYADD